MRIDEEAIRFDGMKVVKNCLCVAEYRWKGRVRWDFCCWMKSCQRQQQIVYQRL